MHIRIWGGVFFFDICFHFSWVEWLDHMVTLSLAFCRTAKLFPKAAILHSHQQCIKFPVSLHPCQHLLLFAFLIIANLVGVKWYRPGVLICISLMTKDVEHLFICLLTICVSFLEKCLFKSFIHFRIRLFVFMLLSCKSSLYILDKSPLLDIQFTNFFSHFVSCPFTCLMVSFKTQNF